MPIVSTTKQRRDAVQAGLLQTIDGGTDDQVERAVGAHRQLRVGDVIVDGGREADRRDPECGYRSRSRSMVCAALERVPALPMISNPLTRWSSRPWPMASRSLAVGTCRLIPVGAP